MVRHVEETPEKDTYPLLMSSVTQDCRHLGQAGQKQQATSKLLLFPTVSEFKRAMAHRGANLTWVLPYSVRELRKKQMEDVDISPILALKEEGVCPYGPKVWASSPMTRHYWLYWETLYLQDGILYRKFTKRDRTRTLNQLVIPQKLQWFISILFIGPS